jgi:hypothetical protein
MGQAAGEAAWANSVNTGVHVMSGQGQAVRAAWKHLVSAAMVMALSTSAGAQIVYTFAIAGGQSVTGASGTIVNALEPTIGAGGHVVARCQLSTGLMAVVVALPGQTPRVVMRTGDQAFGLPTGLTLSLITNAWPDASGRVYIEGDIAGPGVTSSNNKCHWVDASGAVTLIVREGDPTPASAGLPAGTVFGQVIRGSFAGGRSAFAATLSGGGTTTSNDRSLWRFSGGALQLIGREGQSSGIVSGAMWTEFSDPFITESGLVCFMAGVSGDPTQGTVLVRGTPGNLVLLAREGAAATGAGSGVTFSLNLVTQFNGQAMAMNGAGDVLFPSGLAGSGVATDENVGLFLRSGSTTTLVNREGDRTDGFPQIAPFFGEPRNPKMGASGTLAWSTEVRDSVLVSAASDTRVFRRVGNAGSVEAVLLEGAQVPDSPAGTLFDDATSADYFPEVAMNSAGDVMIGCDTSGPAGSTITRALVVRRAGSTTSFRVGPNGAASTLVGAAAPTGTVIGTALATQFNSTGMGRPTSINDAGQCVAIVQFSTSAGTITGACIVNANPANDTGACCVPGGCAVVTASACAGLPGSFRGAGAACNPGGGAATPCCVANFHQSGAVTVQDVFDFLAAFFANAPTADVNGVGGITVQDVFDYLAAFFQGCP